MPFVIGKNCKKATTLSARERPDLFHGRRRRRLVPSARSGGFRRAAPNPLKPIPNYRRDRNKLKTNSSLSSGGGPRGPGPKNKSLPPGLCSYDVYSFMTNIVDIVPRARKAVIEISLSLILATPGCTFLPRAREGQCRQLGTSPIKAVPLQPDPRPRLAASFLGRGVTAGTPGRHSGLSNVGCNRGRRRQR